MEVATTQEEKQMFWNIRGEEPIFAKLEFNLSDGIILRELE
jgi:hypothetical protein